MLEVGLDLVEVERWRRLLGRYGMRFLRRVFSPEELAQCRGPRAAERLAARWAAKEAVVKALGGKAGSWQDLVILRDARGVPQVELRGGWARLARQRGVARWRISLTHERGVAAALAVAWGAGSAGGGAEDEGGHGGADEEAG